MDRIAEALASDEARMDPRLDFCHPASVTVHIDSACSAAMALRPLPAAVDCAARITEAHGLQRCIVERLARDALPSLVDSVPPPLA